MAVRRVVRMHHRNHVSLDPLIAQCIITKYYFELITAHRLYVEKLISCTLRSHSLQLIRQKKGTGSSVQSNVNAR